MSFLIKLGKGFVRSAVNQVGRDSGKVVSNHIYGNAHSSPIRKCDKVYYQEIANASSFDSNKSRIDAERDGYTVTYCKNSISKKVFWFILCVIFLSGIIIAPMIVLFCKGIEKINQKYVIMSKPVIVAQYVRDRRYRTGQRLDGYVQSLSTIKVVANEEDRMKLRRIGKTYIYIAVATTILWICVMVVATLNVA